jgi:hypothetical protein
MTMNLKKSLSVESEVLKAELKSSDVAKVDAL